MTLIDTGPLVALHDARDSFYSACVGLVPQFALQRFVTSWACFAEAMYLLGNSGGFQLQASLWKMWRDGYLELASLSNDETELAATMMDKYQDHPMDLADATLVAVADFRGWRKVFTLDSHFFAYRLRDGSALDVILPTKA